MTVMDQLIIGQSRKKFKKERTQIDGDFSRVKTSNLYQIQVPGHLAGKKYSKLFDYFTSRQAMIPLGLFRTENVNLKEMKKDQTDMGNNSFGDCEKEKLKEIKYVVTNPQKNCKIKKSDLVFVLA